MPRKIQFAVIALAALVGIGSILVWFLTPKPKRFEAIEGRPLLVQDGKEFVDQQVELRFTPPADWAMQARSTEAPMHSAERRLVKYKRVSTSLPPAWLRVQVKDLDDEPSLADILKTRPAPEGDWKPHSDVEEGLKIGGLPAARRTYSAPFNPDGRSTREYHCEIVLVKQNGRLFEFNGAFEAGDQQALREIRQAIESVIFLSE